MAEEKKVVLSMQEIVLTTFERPRYWKKQEQPESPESPIREDNADNVPEPITPPASPARIRTKEELEESRNFVAYHTAMYKKVEEFLIPRLKSFMKRHNTRSTSHRFGQSAVRLCRPFLFYRISHKDVPNPRNLLFTMSYRATSILIAKCDGPHDDMNEHDDYDNTTMGMAYYVDLCDMKYDPRYGNDNTDTKLDPEVKAEIEGAGFRLKPIVAYDQ